MVGKDVTMRTRNKKMKSRSVDLPTVTLAWLLVSSLSSSPCAAELETMRHHRPQTLAKKTDETERMRALSQLWENEALLAQAEADRVLYKWHDVFQSLPPPTQSPGRPTQPPSPTTTTPGPTRSPGTPTAPPAAATNSPTPFNCLVGTTREAFLLEQLSAITSEALLTNPNTPQGQAYLFMVNDPLQPDVCTYPTLNQRYALATIYYGANGANWVDETGWLSATNECSWFGVTCAGGSEVTRLELEENNLVGSLPEELGVLTSLQVLELANNILSGSLPVSMADTTALQVLDVENNQLNGEPLPAQLFLLTNLVQLFLSNNPYQTSSLPREIATLNQLSDFWVANGNLIGPIPTTISSLTSLRTLILYGNELDGTLPTQIGALANIENLQLQENLLADQIPSELFNLLDLDVLRLDFNFFTGNIPNNIGNIASVRDLRLNENFMTGTIPASVDQLTAVERLALGSNFLFGTIPTINSQVLDTADFARAALSGPIPDFFFSIPTMRLLYLNNNGLTGTIPAQFSQPPLLRDLFLHNNNLVGTVPEISPGQLENLNEFTLQGNGLTGSMPQSICTLRQTGILFNLFCDCGGDNPEIQCDFPTCCNRCFQL